MITRPLRGRKYSIDFVSGRALRELEPAAQMYAKVVRLSESAVQAQPTDVLSDFPTTAATEPAQTPES